MSNYDINSLNEEQLAPLKEVKGAVLVTAGAGSGKTRLLTHRVAYLMQEFGVSPFHILAITFTNKAAGEMKARIADMVEGADAIWISTFHSMCVRILRRDISALGYDKNFTIYSEADTEKVIKDVLEERGFSDDKDMKKILSFHLSNWKNGCQTLLEYMQERSEEQDIRKIVAMMDRYEQNLRKNNALDFDDLLRKTLELFTQYPEVLDYYANRFEYICVDEFQDTNSVQYELVKMLASVHGNVFAVGDEDQCIYSWRGANFQNIFNFKKDFPDAKVFKLERNYRSTSKILHVANNVIQNNVSRLDKKMWTDKQDGDEPVLYNARDEREEALYVAKTIERLAAQGVAYKDMAVLMRLNALSRAFEEAFLSYNIPHRIFGGFKFYERVEIRYVIAYLRLFLNPKDDVSFERIVNFPKRSFGESSIAKLRDLAQDNSLLETVLSTKIMEDGAIYKKLQLFQETFLRLQQEPQAPLSEFVGKVIAQFGIREAYHTKSEEDLNRILNIESFIVSVKEYESLNPQATLGDFLETITLKADTDDIGEGGAVTIATVHAVKGLEFKVVFVIGLEENIFPISRAMTKNADMEEERRLLYVALTRAEEKLFMSYCSQRYLYNSSQYQLQSRFIRELGLLNVTEAKRTVPFGGVGGYKKSSFNSWNPSHSASASTDGGGKFFDHNQFIQQQSQEEYKPKKDISIYAIGQRVSHPKFGEGEIVDISSDGLVGDIVFEDFGKKSLMLELAPLEILEG